MIKINLFKKRYRVFEDNILTATVRYSTLRFTVLARKLSSIDEIVIKLIQWNDYYPNKKIIYWRKILDINAVSKKINSILSQ